MHLLIWGHLPSQEEKDHVRQVMAKAMNPPDSVVNVISAFPYVTNPRRWPLNLHVTESDIGLVATLKLCQ